MLSVTPTNGYKFVRWEGDISGTNPSIEITMSKDMNVRAVFEVNEKLTNVNFSVNLQSDNSGVSGTLNLSMIPFSQSSESIFNINSSNTNYTNTWQQSLYEKRLYSFLLSGRLVALAQAPNPNEKLVLTSITISYQDANQNFHQKEIDLGGEATINNINAYILEDFKGIDFLKSTHIRINIKTSTVSK